LCSFCFLFCGYMVCLRVSLLLDIWLL
jgi:hypothetical protein